MARKEMMTKTEITAMVNLYEVRQKCSVFCGILIQIMKLIKGINELKEYKMIGKSQTLSSLKNYTGRDITK